MVFEQTHLPGGDARRPSPMASSLDWLCEAHAQRVSAEIDAFACVGAVAGDEIPGALQCYTQFSQLAFTERRLLSRAHDELGASDADAGTRSRVSYDAVFTSTGNRSRLLSAQFAFGSTWVSRNGCSSSIISRTSNP